MNVSLLPSTQAWTAGAKMWVAPLPENSLWSRKIDWYLNFCLTKGIYHKSQSRPIALESLLKKIAWKIPTDVDLEHEPLLIAASLRLPCDWVLLLKDFEAEKKKFSASLKTLSTVWSQIGKPRLRMFAPTQFNRDHIVDCWSKHELPAEFEFILE